MALSHAAGGQHSRWLHGVAPTTGERIVGRASCASMVRLTTAECIDGEHESGRNGWGIVGKLFHS